jgi:hypothetical protein
MQLSMAVSAQATTLGDFLLESLQRKTLTRYRYQHLLIASHMVEINAARVAFPTLSATVTSFYLPNEFFVTCYVSAFLFRHRLQMFLSVVSIILSRPLAATFSTMSLKPVFVTFLLVKR